MPSLSKDAELELLKEAFGKIGDQTDWQPFLDKVSEFLNCKACAAEYLSSGFATGRFTGLAHADAFKDFLSGPVHHQGVPAFKFLLELAQTGAVYQIHEGHISKLDAPDTSLTSGIEASSRSAIIRIIRDSSGSTMMFGLRFDGVSLAETTSAETVLAFTKVSKILETCFEAISNIDSLKRKSRIQQAFANHCTVPSVLVNRQRIVIAEHENGLSVLADLDVGLMARGKLQIRNRELEMLLSDISSAPPTARVPHKTGQKQDTKSESALFRSGFCLRDQSGNLNRVTIEAVSGDKHDPWILLRVCQPANIPESVETILQEELGLSQSEAHLARSLAETGSVSATIDLLNITRNTMKTHLRRIFDKTAVRTQLELVQLVYRLSGLV
ncbi:helix-turn-helix transcriptional regulator [Roseibium sp.]|uniref:helix-turn-helix transcriptional regulator n=1 Tax=Roseibium sp. TaxID=1936156 RepID=UPI003D0E4F97